MKAKRVVGVLAALLLCICMIMPVNTDAAAQVRVRPVLIPDERVIVM